MLWDCVVTIVTGNFILGEHYTTYLATLKLLKSPVLKITLL